MAGAVVGVVGDAESARRWVGHRESHGRRRRDAEELPREPWDLADRAWVIERTVASDTDVGPVVLASLRGVEVAAVVVVAAMAELLLDDLRRVGVSVEMPSDVAPARPSVELPEDARELLALLAGGASMAEAAAAVHVSLRTAERRIGVVRRQLGVRTTAEALAIVFPA
jgi:hypothetical protein